VVAGFDPGDRRTARQLREQIGLVLQELAVQPYLTVRESTGGFVAIRRFRWDPRPE